MCGICGVMDFGGTAVDGDLLRQMVRSMRHRGPDAEGYYADGGVGLGHARLSIVDIAGGGQPMRDAAGSTWITFNGEIFNHVELREELRQRGHRFTTRSDTEVILHLYQEAGEQCVERLNGQWAFAIWDAAQQKLFLSRDRLGVRPLFYTRIADRFLFASEIKALLACGEVERTLDLRALDEIFTFWVTAPPRTAFRNIRQLPPGHSMAVERGEVRVWQYWGLESSLATDGGGRGVAQAAEDLLHLLRDATRIRLRSDVPVGAYLSGGLDSTLIAALIRQLAGERLRTFSVSFDDAEFDESRYQEDACRFLGTEHSDIRCSAEDIAEAFPAVVRHAEQPVLRAAPAPLFRLSGLVRDRGFKVVLTGEGADEMLGGYDIFKETKIRRFWAQRPESRLRPLLLKRLYPYMPSVQRQPEAYLRTFFHVREEDRGSPFFSHLPRWELTAKLHGFFSAAVRAEVRPGAALADLERGLPRAYWTWDAFRQAEYLEARYLLPGYILSSQGDRVAMAHSVEARYPFLDHRVVEFAAQLPARLKMRVLNEKYLLKVAAAGMIPENIRKRRKQPYRCPDGRSFFRRKCGYAEDLLGAERLRRHGIFDPPAVGALLQKFRSGRPVSVKDDMAMVGILSTELLLEQFTSHGAAG